MKRLAKLLKVRQVGYEVKRDYRFLMAFKKCTDDEGSIERPL